MRTEYNKKYYEEHKDYFKKWSKSKIHCECCNKDITAPNYSAHCKSTSHIKNLELKNKVSLNDIKNNPELIELVKSIIQQQQALPN
jgi:hypothetical protein